MGLLLSKTSLLLQVNLTRQIIGLKRFSLTKYFVSLADFQEPLALILEFLSLLYLFIQKSTALLKIEYQLIKKLTFLFSMSLLSLSVKALVLESEPHAFLVNLFSLLELLLALLLIQLKMLIFQAIMPFQLLLIPLPLCQTFSQQFQIQSQLFTLII